MRARAMRSGPPVTHRPTLESSSAFYLSSMRGDNLFFIPTSTGGLSRDRIVAAQEALPDGVRREVTKRQAQGSQPVRVRSREPAGSLVGNPFSAETPGSKRWSNWTGRSV